MYTYVQVPYAYIRRYVYGTRTCTHKHTTCTSTYTACIAPIASLRLLCIQYTYILRIIDVMDLDQELVCLIEVSTRACLHDIRLSLLECGPVCICWSTLDILYQIVLSHYQNHDEICEHDSFIRNTTTLHLPLICYEISWLE